MGLLIPKDEDAKILKNFGNYTQHHSLRDLHLYILAVDQHGLSPGTCDRKDDIGTCLSKYFSLSLSELFHQCSILLFGSLSTDVLYLLELTALLSKGF